MEIRKQVVNSINVTCVFQTINHDAFDFESLKKTLAIDPEENPESVNLSIPVQYHVINLPKSKYIFTIEDNRLTVEDRSLVGVEKSNLIEQFIKTYNLGFQGLELTAYGFNYMAQVEFDKDYSFLKHAEKFFDKDFVSQLQVQGLNTGLRYIKDGISYQNNLTSLAPNAIGQTLNAHRAAVSLPSKEVLSEQLQAGWRECQAIFSSLA